MNIETILAPVMALLPDAWGEDGRLIGAVFAALLLAALVMGVVAHLVDGARRRGGGKTMSEERILRQPSMPVPAAGVTLRPDLDPDEWVAGSVIHLDRHKALGLIRCDRVKGPVRFRLAADGAALPRVGEKVRFQGRHGARRRPVADRVERAV